MNGCLRPRRLAIAVGARGAKSLLAEGLRGRDADSGPSSMAIIDDASASTLSASGAVCIAAHDGGEYCRLRMSARRSTGMCAGRGRWLAPRTDAEYRDATRGP